MNPRTDDTDAPKTAIDEMLLVDDPGDRQVIENCHPPQWRNPTPAKRYNLVVLGGGTAGLVSAAGAAGLGAKVALIERNLLGGDCLNVGCVPSKAIRRAARAAYEARNGARFGIEQTGEVKFDFTAAMARMRALRAQLSAHDSVERFTRLGVDVFLGDGRFTGPETIEVDGHPLHFNRAVIATGARPTVPAIPGLRESGFYTNETIFTLTVLPRRLAVVGAGPLGCELAQAFRRFGSEVVLITHGSTILPREDADAAAVLRRQVERENLRVITGANITRVEVEAGARRLFLKVADKEMIYDCDAILVAAGRTPNSENLGLEKAGVRSSPTGVEVDARLRTANSKIFAAGDVCAPCKFTHAADAMARIVIANALFPARRKVSDLVIPWCTYTDPEIAHVGWHEKDAEAAGFPVGTMTEEMSKIDRAVLDGETDGFARVHYDKKTGKILGGTIVAPHAGEMIGALALAIGARQGIGALSSTIFPYPTQAEALRKIGDAYMRGKLTPMVRKGLSKWLEWRR